MDGNYIPIGSSLYFWLLLGLILARGLDFLSTYIATPKLKLEANPIAAWLGWKWGMVVNLVLCIGMATFVIPAVMLITTSVLVAARNLEHAWLMRSMGELNYQMFMSERLHETSLGLVLGCYWGNGGLHFILGLALVLISRHIVVLSIGFGIIGFATAVIIFTTLSLWRSRRKIRYDEILERES